MNQQSNEHPFDVYIGRGNGVEKRVGTKYYRKLVNKNKPIYKSLTSHIGKEKMALEIINDIKTKGGRFYDASSGRTIPGEVLLSKVKQALREIPKPKPKPPLSQNKKQKNACHRRQKASPGIQLKQNGANIKSEDDSPVPYQFHHDCDKVIDYMIQKEAEKSFTSPKSVLPEASYFNSSYKHPVVISEDDQRDCVTKCASRTEINAEQCVMQNLRRAQEYENSLYISYPSSVDEWTILSNISDTDMGSKNNSQSDESMTESIKLLKSSTNRLLYVENQTLVQDNSKYDHVIDDDNSSIKSLHSNVFNDKRHCTSGRS
jgi:hypothetical protein